MHILYLKPKLVYQMVRLGIPNGGRPKGRANIWSAFPSWGIFHFVFILNLVGVGISNDSKVLSGASAGG